ncbi:hypothetical protein D3C84_1287570 [compost metagenome]
MLGYIRQQRVRAFERVPGFAADTECVESRHALQRGQGDFERIALYPFWRLAQQDQRALS